MLNKWLFVWLMVILAGCSVLSPSAPRRFSDFEEQQIAGPGAYAIPEWSSDSRYLAFVDESGNQTLSIYDTETEDGWNVATNISTTSFGWGPNSTLSYLRYRPDLSGSPYPIIFDLHQVDLDGQNDRIIAGNLEGARDFAWFSDGVRIAILLAPDRAYFNDVYILNTVTGATDLLLAAEAIDLRYIVMIALSPDEKSILLYGVQEENGESDAQIVTYDLESESIIDRFAPSQVIPSRSTSYPMPVIGDGTNYGWVNGNRWFLTSINAPSGKCYNYALFFFDMDDLRSSFCIPTIEGIISDPAISPDLTKISYVTVAGVGQYYVMIADTTPELLNRLELGDNT